LAPRQALSSLQSSPRLLSIEKIPRTSEQIPHGGRSQPPFFNKLGSLMRVESVEKYTPNQLIDVLEQLPIELGLNILFYLKPSELGKCCRVSKTWQIVASDNTLWKKIWEKTFKTFDNSGFVHKSESFKTCLDALGIYLERSKKILHSKDEILQSVEEFAKKISLNQSGLFICQFPLNPEYFGITAITITIDDHDCPSDLGNWDVLEKKYHMNKLDNEPFITSDHTSLAGHKSIVYANGSMYSYKKRGLEAHFTFPLLYQDGLEERIKAIVITRINELTMGRALKSITLYAGVFFFGYMLSTWRQK
jgi:hypothetical protein